MAKSLLIDNGAGIPKHILSKLFSEKMTYGKDGGNGLGLNHAHSLVHLWGGEITIDSEVGRGANVSIVLPIASSPVWFADSINVVPNKPVIILDDDSSIHQVWTQRFHDLSVNVIHYSGVHEFRARLLKEKGNVQDFSYLIDYEILGEKVTGIDLINEFNIHQDAILVTSRHEEDSVITQCIESGVRLLPKTISAFVPIKVFNQLEYDAVLIDDDLIVQELWNISAADHGKKIKIFSDAVKFLSSQNEISRKTTIFIDSILGDGCRGEIIAKDIYQLGFRSIYLVTGMPSYHYKDMPYLSGVLNKTPPWEVELEVVNE